MRDDDLKEDDAVLGGEDGGAEEDAELKNVDSDDVDYDEDEEESY